MKRKHQQQSKRGREEFYPIITIAGFLRLWDLYNAFNVAIRVENITLLWIETAKRLWFNAMSVCFGAFRMLWCYRTFSKQQNATLLLQRLNCCHLARSGLKVLKAQAIDLYNVWAAGKDDSSLLKNQIENDKALESSSSIIEELHKNIKDNEDELEQVKKTHVKTIHELETADAFVDDLKL